MSNAARLSYVVLVASVNREGTSLWGEGKLLKLAGVSESDWVTSLGELVNLQLVEIPSGEELGIKVLNLDPNENVSSRNKAEGQMATAKVIRPLVLRTITTVELEGFHADLLGMCLMESNYRGVENFATPVYGALTLFQTYFRS